MFLSKRINTHKTEPFACSPDVCLHRLFQCEHGYLAGVQWVGDRTQRGPGQRKDLSTCRATRSVRGRIA